MLNPRLDKRDDGTWVEVRGIVERLLSSDGLRHQRFVLNIGAGRTVLIAHNIDVAEPVPLGIGDRVQVRGLYEWNDRGGLMHWTHRDPLGIEAGGFVRYRRTEYR